MIHCSALGGYDGSLFGVGWVRWFIVRRGVGTMVHCSALVGAMTQISAADTASGRNNLQLMEMLGEGKERSPLTADPSPSTYIQPDQGFHILTRSASDGPPADADLVKMWNRWDFNARTDREHYWGTAW